MSQDKTGTLCQCGHLAHFGRCSGRTKDNKPCTCENVYYGNTGFSNKI